jgi:hypothetical protein
MIDFNLTIKVGVGPFLIGAPIKKLLLAFPYEKHILKDFPSYGENRIYYSFFNESLSVFVDKMAKIDDISCKRECRHNGTNLIGLKFDLFLSHFNLSGDNLIAENIYTIKEGRGQTQQVYDIAELDLQVWVYRKKIVTIIVSNMDGLDD